MESARYANETTTTSRLSDDDRPRLFDCNIDTCFARQQGRASRDQALQQFVFKAFSRHSLVEIKRRKQLLKVKRVSIAQADATKQKPEPDACLVSGQQLPPYIVRKIPPELIGKPIEDIDPFYADKETFVIISKGHELIRFSANKALYLLGPFHPIRRIVLYILVSSTFNMLVILTILTNCILMTFQGSESVEKTDTIWYMEPSLLQRIFLNSKLALFSNVVLAIIFTIIYTTEFGLKVLARGFVMEQFTYLRDPWNLLDITVITLSYLTIVIQDLGNLSVMRTFRVLRALKTVAIIPGMKTIVGAVIDSVKNLKDVVVLTLFSLSVFSLLGLQIYMGLLTQKCVSNGPENMTELQWHLWNSNSSNWILDLESETRSYKLCGNATGAQLCPPSYTCLQGFGPNPDYGFTNFDTFGWALICSFRLMTQDYWEGLYMQVLKTAGSWHIIFFVVSIFLGSIYLMNLILAIVAMSYNELQRRAEEEEEAAIEDEAAFCRLLELQERASQFSRSSIGDGPASSYRPSVEIGLVGQTLLASLCQNGLLDERLREKLDKQMMLPGGGGGGFDDGELTERQGALRSRSLCVNIDNYVRGRRLNGQRLNSCLAVPGRGQASFGDPLAMAASMNELRRKSSVRTFDSGSSPSNGPSQQHQQASLVGQRRLMRNISVSGHKLNSTNRKGANNLFSSVRLRDRNKLSPHHVSSGVLMPSLSGGEGFKLGTRSSTTSDRDLEVLKQKAALIRIVSEDCSKFKNEEGTFARFQVNNSGSIDDNSSTLAKCDSDLSFDDYNYQKQHNQRMPLLIARRLSQGYAKPRAPSMQFGSIIRRRRAGSSSLSNATFQNMSIDCLPNQQRRSEAVICEQPSEAHPLGRASFTASAAATNLHHDLGQQASNSLDSPPAALATRSTSLRRVRRRLSSVQQHRQRQSSFVCRRCSETSHDSPKRRISSSSAAEAAIAAAPFATGPSCPYQHQHQRRLRRYQHPEPSQQASGSPTKFATGGRLHRSFGRQSPSSRSSTNLVSDLRPLDPEKKCISMRTLRPSGTSLSSQSEARLGGDQAGLLSANYSSASQRRGSQMHHLSVENFQQFGAIRPAATLQAQQQQRQQPHFPIAANTRPFARTSQQQELIEIAGRLSEAARRCSSFAHHQQQQHHPQHQDRELQTAAGTALTAKPSNAIDNSATANQSLRQRTLEGLSGEGRPTAAAALAHASHPGGVSRMSFARIRQSIQPGSSLVPSLEQQRYLQQRHAAASTGGGPPQSQIRRLSRDFVQQAGEWSRLSMTTNVDMRRLLRLWSRTNPYQTRQSVGSCSMYSQTNQLKRNQAPVNGGGDFSNASESNQPQAAHHDQGLGQSSPEHSLRGAGRVGDPFTSSYFERAHPQASSPRASSVNSQAWQAYEVLSAMSSEGGGGRYQSDARAFGAALPLDDIQTNGGANNGPDSLSVSCRDNCLAYCLSCLDLVCIWECCAGWVKIQRVISAIVFDPFTELFILLCILINTLFMALDNDDVDEQMRRMFEQGNYFFTATFAVEASMKIIALSPKFYFREGFNVFDSIIVGLSLLELGLEGVYGLSVLRTFRLLRVFRLARSWPTMNVLISICGHAISDLGNLTFVLAIIVFIFAVMGMQLFGNKYTATNFPSGELPRWNFTDFMHSFMIVFRILCAEWIEPMWDCLLVGGWPCIPFFLIAVTVGNLVVFNLFLALLLASFGASNLASPQADNVDTRKLQEAIERFKRFGRFSRRNISLVGSRIWDFVLRRDSKRRNNTAAGSGARDQNQWDAKGGAQRGTELHNASMSRLERLQNIERRMEELKTKIKRSPEHHYHLRQLAKSQLEISSAEFAASASASAPSTTTRLNYNYANKAPSYQKAAAGSTGAGEPVVTIPIIVNEATDVNASGCSTYEHKLVDEYVERPECELQVQAQPRQPSAHSLTFKPDERLDEVAEELSSLNSDSISLEMSVDSISRVEPTHHDFGETCSPVGGAKFELDEDDDEEEEEIDQGEDEREAGLHMQTIVEDSRDESCLSPSPPSGEKKSPSPANKQEKLSPAGSLNTQLGLEDKLSASIVGEPACDSTRTKHDLLSCANKPTPPMSRPKANFCAPPQLTPLLSKSAPVEPEERFKRLIREQQRRSQQLQQPKLSGFEPIQSVPAANQQVRGGWLYVNKNNEKADDGNELELRPKSSVYLQAPKREEMDEEDEQTLQHIERYIERSICIGIICLKWFLLRQRVRKIVEHKYFDQCILILIIISSGTLALEDKHLNERPALMRTLDVLDTIFTIIFSLEMIFKWLAFGMRRYFGNIWSWLDFIIVLVGVINLMASIFGSGKIQALKTMRTLRAMRGLRPLRALQRFQGMRVVVNALIQAIPSIFNVLLVCLIFWLIFSIMGVQMFGGKFWRCLSPVTGKLVSFEQASNKIECIERNLTWSNPQINFDNVLNAYLALFEVATFKGWISIMDSATDSRMRDEQPIREANIYMYFYFVFFVIFGSFFTLNLFIGVIIDNFNEQKRKTGGSLEIFMTDDQKKYYHAMKKMRSKRPVKAMTRPKFKLQAYVFDLTTSKKFDLAIMLIIGLNMFVMALEHYGQSQEFTQALENLNLIFIAIFTLECLSKIFAMRHYYFREPWNMFDFTVVNLSILGVMTQNVAKYFVSPTLLRVVRVVKVGRVLRLVKSAKGIRTLLFALAMSLPALFNICLLLFLVMFIYAIFGMSFFMNVRKRAGIDDTFNFETFTSSIIVLFQISTSAAWDVVLDPLMDEENDCQKPDPIQGIEGTCGNKSIAIFYLVSYVIVTYLIIINMYIAVILENYSQATEDVQEGLTDDDYEMYYEIWQKFDPDGTQYLPYERLSDFVDALEDPLRIAKPNELALVVLDINIYEGNQCYCVDILDALTKYFFTRKGLDIQVNEHLQQVQSTLHETPFERITTTYLLKREHYCARVIQNCWRRWRERVAAKASLKGP